MFFSFSEKIIQHNLEVSGNTIQYISKYISGIKNVISEIKPNVILVCDDGLKPRIINTMTIQDFIKWRDKMARPS